MHHKGDLEGDPAAVVTFAVRSIPGVLPLINQRGVCRGGVGVSVGGMVKGSDQGSCGGLGEALLLARWLG